MVNENFGRHNSFEGEQGKKRMAMKIVASVLGYGNVQVLLQKTRPQIRDEIIRMLQDFAATSDLLEEDDKTIEDKEGLGSMNEDFLNLYNNALNAGFISESDLEEVYPPIPYHNS